MARKSRKHLNTETVMRSTPKENVGYIRLSVSNKEESNSIENQKSIIKHWAEQHQLSISRFYIDATVIIGLKQNPTNGRRFSPIFLLYRAFCGAKHRMPL